MIFAAVGKIWHIIAVTAASAHRPVVCSSLIFTSLAFASTAFSADPSLWVESRSRIQHFMSMQQSPVGIKSSLGASKFNSTSIGAVECAVRQKFQLGEKKKCLEYLAVILQEKLSPLETTRLLIAIENLKAQPQPLSWQDALVLAGSAASLGDASIAKRILKDARDDANRNGLEWVMRRLAIFESVVDLLAEKDSQKRQYLFANAAEMHRGEEIFAEVGQRLEQALGRKRQDGSEAMKATPEAVLRELKYRSWQLEQEREELSSVAKIFERREPEIFDFYRLDQLVRRYDSGNKEWKAIINLISGMTSGVELLMRQGALQMLMEHWIANSSPQTMQVEADQELAFVRSRLVLYEVTAVLARAFSQLREDKRFEWAWENLEALEQRMVLLPSPLAAAFNDSLFERDLQAVQTVQSRMTDIEKRMRRAHALLASYYLVSSLDASDSRNISNVRAEMKELENQKRELLLEFFKMTVVLQPNVQKDFRALIRLNAQVKKSLKDFRTLMGESNKPTDAAFLNAMILFLDDADALVNRIESESYRSMAARKAVGERIVKELNPLQTELGKLSSEISSIMRSSATELRPALMRTIVAIDSNLIAKSREIELKVSLAEASLRDDVAQERESARATRARLELLRRLRSENLDWRVAQ